MTSVWFVTPAWQRFELTAVCLDQRLAVIADDANLDLARERGFDTVERDNEWLGRRFNDGMEYAGRNGADWIVPIGSDSWIDPAYFVPLLAPGYIRTSGLYCAVTAERMAELKVRSGRGAGPYVFNRDHLAPSGFRPAQDDLRKGIDGSTIRGVGQANWRWRNLHPFQYIGFRGNPHITSYGKLHKRWGVREHDDPWAILAKHYPAELVERARMALAQPERVAA